MNIDALLQLGPELILLVGACVTLIVGAQRVSRWASPFALAVVLLALFTSLGLGVPVEPGAIPGLQIASLTFYTRAIALTLGALIILVNWHQAVSEERGEYMALILFSLLGVLLTASADDLIVLFFAIELVSVPTYVLIALSRVDGRASESAVKYFFLGAMSTAILAYGMSFLYGAAGTTSLSQVAGGNLSSPWSASGSVGSFALIGLLLTFAGLAFKVAAVPLHFYLADVYEGAASPVAGMLGFVPKLAGFLALAKIFAACDWSPPVEVYWTVWVVAAATMTAGNVLALLQSNVKRVLAYSSIAHTGYMMIALFVGPVAGQGPLSDGVAALLFYIAVYGAMNLGAFAVLASFRVGDREAETWDDLAGLSVRAPLVALALAICAFSLMGIPPTAGFIGKIFIFSSAFSLPADHAFHGPLVVLAVIGVVNSAIGAAYYLRMAATPYLRAEVEETVPSGGAPLRWGLALCTIPMLVLFVWPVGLADQARRAAVALKNTAGIQHMNLAAGEAEDDPSPQTSTSASSNASLAHEPEAR